MPEMDIDLLMEGMKSQDLNWLKDFIITKDIPGPGPSMEDASE